MCPQNVSTDDAIAIENTTMCAPFDGIVAEERKMAALTSKITPNQY